MNKTKKDERVGIILKTFSDFGIKMESVEVMVGPAISYFVFKLITPTRMKDLDTFDRDLNHALGVSDIKIDAPIRDKSLIGIEVPNKERAFVDIKEMWDNQEFLRNKEKLLIPFGRMVGNKDLFIDLFTLSHLLISGSTGSGKSNFLHCLISSLIKKFSAEEVKFILVDNKRVEFNIYDGIPHLLTKPIEENKKTINALSWLNREMEIRYKLLEDAGVMDIVEYNKKCEEKMPHILFIEDEFVDDMIIGKKRFEDKIIRILQMGRAIGLHIILSTSRPSKKNIENLMGANITARLCFAVCCSSDSKVVIYSAGAERLSDKGDALFLDNGSIKPIRLQTPYISDAELKGVIESAKEHYYFGQNDDAETNVISEFDEERMEDELYDEVKAFAIKNGRISPALIQRKFRIGYNRAALLIDMLEKDSVIGEADGSKPRDVFEKKK